MKRPIRGVKMGYLEALELWVLVILIYFAGYFYGLNKGRRGREMERMKERGRQWSWAPVTAPCSQCGEPRPVAGEESLYCAKCGAHYQPKGS